MTYHRLSEQDLEQYRDSSLWRILAIRERLAGREDREELGLFLDTANMLAMRMDFGEPLMSVVESMLQIAEKHIEMQENEQ